MPLNYQCDYHKLFLSDLGLLVFSCLANAKMDITYIEVAGFPLPPGSPAEACLGIDLVAQSGALKLMTKVTDDGNDKFSSPSKS